jgi:peptidylprolyl isomerase
MRTRSERRATIRHAPGSSLGLAIIFSAAAALAGDADIIARIGNNDVKAEDVRAYIEMLDPREQAAVATNPSLLTQAVRQLLAARVVIKEALAKRWDQQPAIAAQLERVRENAIAETYLQAVSKPPDDFPGEAELQNAYEANKTAFLAPRQFHIAQIFIAATGADKPAEERARKKLDDIQKKLKARGADFAALAQTESEDADSAKRGGELAWAFENQLNPEIRAQILGLAKDTVSDPVRLGDGWHVVKLLDTKPAYTRPLAEVREQLAQRLRAERAQENRRAYVAKLLEQNPLAINELALAKLLNKPGK